MAQNSISTGFSMYSPRRLERVSFGAFQGAGIDQFTDPVSQDPNKFLNLTNVMPSVGGAFLRRWFLNQRGTALPHTSQYNRMFSYAAAADVTFAGTVDSRLLLATDNTHISAIYDEIGGAPAFDIPDFGGSGDVYGLTSRSWFYASDGVGTPQKIDYSQQSTNTSSRWGIPTPVGVIGSGPQLGVSGLGYTSTPTVSITGGGGSGATAVAAIAQGGIWQVGITAAGSGYTSIPTVTITGGGGTGGDFVAVVGNDGTVISVVMTGNIVLNSGRTYAIALQNSITGHVSDYIYAPGSSRYEPNSIYSANPLVDPDYLTKSLNQGCEALLLPLSISAASIDSQVDTIILMATSDGGDVEHLYEVDQIPLSAFTLGGGNYTLLYTDLLPDTFTDTVTSGDTLLSHNLWVDTDANGDVIGINDNTPPPDNLNKHIICQGRMFATDGKSVFFSKSIDEVTTSTGLITSKWEEAWPGSNQLDIAYDDELITALLSDGETVYIGTTDNVYRMLGNNASNFSIPTTIWRGVGVQAQDVWSVIYKDNIPAGYVWTTPDNKIMFSDFNTYSEIGKPVYPLLLDRQVTYTQSVSYGPYSFAIFSAGINDAGNAVLYLVYDTKNGGWYEWTRSIPGSNLAGAPILSYTNASGIQNLYTILGVASSGVTSYLQFFDPQYFQDFAIGSNPASAVPWFIETSWLNLMDTASSVVLNELEIWSNDPNIAVSLYSALVSQDFDTPILVKTGQPVLTPFGNKFFLAGSKSFGRFHKVQLYTDSSTGLSTENIVLRQFQFELFPQAKA